MNEILERKELDQTADFYNSRLASEKEKRLIEKWNKTDRCIPNDTCAHRVFETQVKKYPKRTSIKYLEKSLTYEELNHKANQLANYLVSKDIAVDSLIGILLDRSLDMIIAILGIWKAGCAYVPIDSSYSMERKLYMLNDSNMKYLVTHTHLMNTSILMESDVTLFHIDCDSFQNSLALQPSENLDSRSMKVNSNNLAYVIYTSGSTGKPKGVQIEHLSLVNFHINFSHFLEIDALQKPYDALHVASISFDASIKQLVHLMYGGCMHILPEKHRVNPPEFINYIRTNNITSFDITPSLMKTLLEFLDGTPIADHKVWVILGGELVDNKLWDKLSQLNNSTCINTYGPTECTVNATSTTIKGPGAPPTIGPPLPNVKCYVLNSKREMLGIGAVGELYIAGLGLARGYLNKPKLTEKKFTIHNEIGCRMYATGDYVRFLDSGVLEYIGRLDNQVKIRGYRVELGEIESAFLAHDKVKVVSVVTYKDSNERIHLIAYIVPCNKIFPINSEHSIRLQEELFNYISFQLPTYMVPSAILLIDSLPLTNNGKIDKKSLPKPELRNTRTNKGRQPKLEIEKSLAATMENLLGINELCMEDDFFALGGDSLLAIKLLNHIRSTLEKDIPYEGFFETPTLDFLVDAVNLEKEIDKKNRIPYTKSDREMALPISSGEKIMWELCKHSNVCVQRCLRLSGELHINILQQCFEDLSILHEGLRAVFSSNEKGQTVKNITTKKLLSFSHVVLKSKSEIEARDFISKLRHNDIQSLDHNNGPTLKATTIEIKKDQFVFVLTAHHMVCDAWSINILLRDLSILYKNRVTDDNTSTTKVDLEYIDYANWENQWLQSEQATEKIRYWKKVVSDLPQPFNFNSETNIPSDSNAILGWVDIDISNEDQEKLQTLARSENATLFMIILTAISIALSETFEAPDILVDGITAGRNISEVESTVGYFVDGLILRNTIDVHANFEDVLKCVRSSTIEAFNHQQIPFSTLFELSQGRLRPHLLLDIPPPRELSTFYGTETDWIEDTRETTMDTFTSTVDTLLLFIPDIQRGIRGGLIYRKDNVNSSDANNVVSAFNNVINRLTQSNNS